MIAADYRHALARGAVACFSFGTSVAADVSPTDSPWDPELTTAMSRIGRPAFEEALLDLLLADLVRGRPTMP